ncbi:hypothetical protein CQW29_18610 [Pantoea coffeiphila]|uniref:Uncharacterized protein n=1 Tax=Pantoea coffeiphila TaxID=1465635 RepID=A0A2S9I8B3_9GAMM|nr:hypothetical protein CQW29_18610 [Pantoea coffeiphila]
MCELHYSATDEGLTNLEPESVVFPTKKEAGQASDKDWTAEIIKRMRQKSAWRTKQGGKKHG